jgi:hypothetical protein
MALVRPHRALGPHFQPSCLSKTWLLLLLSESVGCSSVERNVCQPQDQTVSRSQGEARPWGMDPRPSSQVWSLGNSGSQLQSGDLKEKWLFNAASGLVAGCWSPRAATGRCTSPALPLTLGAP